VTSSAASVPAPSSWLAPVLVAVLSTIAGGAALALQGRSLGDDPLVMLALGGVLAFVAGLTTSASPWRLGIAAMLGFPVWAVVDMVRGGDHNLFPFEFAMYAVYAAVGGLMVGLGRWLAYVFGRR
jgi:peptidoglycan/LPS O-acetylase OafA/YrhL